MPNWGFFEWLTYACIGIAALVIAFDQGIKLSKAREQFASLIGSPIWAFTPFVLILASAVIIAGRLLLPVAAPIENMTPSNVAKQPSAVLQPQVLTVNTDLSQLTDQEVRAVIYTINEQVNDLVDSYNHDEVSLSGSPESKGAAKLVLDEKLNRDFRDKFSSTILKIDAEVAKRLKIDDSAHLAFPMERIDSVDVRESTYHLIVLANRLP